MFTRLLRTARRAVRPGCRLALEHLEARTLLSASDLVASPFLTVTPLAGSGSTPYTPAQIRHAYGFDQVTFTAGGKSVVGDGSGQTIAIVDAYHDATIASDLHAFDQKFGLPDPKLTVATPQGKPAANSGWDLEIALDVEWAHAIAPKANILLVEAKSNSLSDLLGAVQYAGNTAGVSVVSMSWGAGEFSGEASYDSYFGHAGVSYVASSGDNGAGASWPSISSKVLSVGGTSLTMSTTSTYTGETTWTGSGGGTSHYISEPTYQRGAQTTGYRANPDVAYDANPSTGFYVYTTSGGSGWYAVGGTSAGAPQWAALVAIADQGRALSGKAALANIESDVYFLSTADFHDVVTGSNGYSAKAGYDLATGLGSPIANKVVADLVSGNVAATIVNGKFTVGAKLGSAQVNAVGDQSESGAGRPAANSEASGGSTLNASGLWSCFSSPSRLSVTLLSDDQGAAEPASNSADDLAAERVSFELAQALCQSRSESPSAADGDGASQDTKTTEYASVVGDDLVGAAADAV